MEDYLLAGSAFMLLTVGLYGCSTSCKEVRTSYDQAKSSELAGEMADDSMGSEEEASGEPSPHFAVSIRTRFLESQSDELIGRAIESFLEGNRSLKGDAARMLDVETLPEVKNLDLSRREESCPYCFRIRGDIGGTLDVTPPMSGKRTVPVDGKFDFVAPVDVRPTDTGGVLVVDLAEAAKHNAVPLTLSVTKLEQPWRQLVQEMLASRLSEKLFEQLEPVEIVRFDSPDFGIDGLEVRPTGLRIADDDETISALFSTSIPIPQPPNARELAGAATPADGRQFALAFPTRLVPAAVAVSLNRDETPRRYDLRGVSSEEGPVRVTAESFGLGEEAERPASGGPGTGGGDRSGGTSSETAAPSDSRGLPFSFGFRAFHLPDSDEADCFMFRGTAFGDASITDEAIRLRIVDVNLTSRSPIGLALQAASWTSAEFLRKGTSIAEVSLSTDNIGFPESDVALGNIDVRADDGFVTMSAVEGADDDETVARRSASTW